MKPHPLPVMIGFLAAISLSPRTGRSLDLKFDEVRLPNGLHVIVHEDHEAPQIAVNVTYRVGSKDDPPARTGVAHLFEHLMFEGTTRAPNHSFNAWTSFAGGECDATTAFDVTEYHCFGSGTVLPLFLWLEADRMATFGRDVKEPILRSQVAEVRSERREKYENLALMKVWLRLPELLYPHWHPYGHPRIGSQTDLEAVSIDDIRKFFERYYTPGNASLAIAGDVKSLQVRQLVERYFGSIPAAPVGGLAKPVAPPADSQRQGIVRETIHNANAFPKIVMAFHSVRRFEAGDAELELLASMLASGTMSRLHKALVTEKQLAMSVNATQDSNQISSKFTVEAVLRPHTPLDIAEEAIDIVLREVIAQPPSESDLASAKARFELRFLDGLQTVAARAQQLNFYWATRDDAGYINRNLERYQQATTAGILKSAQQTLTLDSRVIVRVVPGSAPGRGGRS